MGIPVLWTNLDLKRLSSFPTSSPPEASPSIEPPSVEPFNFIMSSGFISDQVNDSVASPGSEAIDPDVLKEELDVILGFVLGFLGLLVVARFIFLQISGSNSRGLVKSLAGFLDCLLYTSDAADE